jgi:hypothetical protein
MVRLHVVAQGKARWKGEPAVTEPVTATFVTEGVKEAPKLLDCIWESFRPGRTLCSPTCRVAVKDARGARP